MMGKPIWIAIPTFRRPTKLRHLLETLARVVQRQDVMVLVADNDGQAAEGAAVVEALQASDYPLPLSLLRVTEPGGGFLRSNDPAGDRWYSRDVAAIAAARGVTEAAPYFIDAEASPAGGYPVGGLTVLKFRNNHLVYALTWFALDLMLIAAAAYVARSEWKRRR